MTTPAAVRFTVELILDTGPENAVLTHCNVWSADGQWIAFDTRSAHDGSVFDGTAIRVVNVTTGEVRTIYESKNGACCGVVTWHPHETKVAFILGPEHPTADYHYGPSRRRGVIVEVSNPSVAIDLDARDTTSPGTPGALRGGSHVHLWRGDGQRISFTYEDDLTCDGLRTIAVAEPGIVTVPRVDHNHDGTWHSRIAVNVTKTPRPGSDDVLRACEESWIGNCDRLAFQGTVLTAEGKWIVEVFSVEFGGRASDGLFASTPPSLARPADKIRRLTHTPSRVHPGIQGPRHWLKSTADGRIGCLMKDDAGVVQLFLAHADDGSLRQLTHATHGVQSAFTWNAAGTLLAAKVDDHVCVIDAQSGEVTRVSDVSTDGDFIRPEAVVFAPDGSRVVFMRTLKVDRSVGRQPLTPGPPKRGDGRQNCIVISEVPR
jgi:hypothetical protein